MRFSRLARTLSLVVLLGWTGTSLAESASGGKVYIAIFGGPQKYSMSDVNSEIRHGNEEVEGSGFVVDEIGGGTAFGAGIRVWPSAKLGLLFDFMRLAASTSKDARIDGTRVAVDIKLPASALTATAGYFRTWHRLRYGLGAGAGYYICNGKIEASVGTERTSSDVTGKGPGFHALAMGDIRASSLHFEAAIGYRSAKTNLHDEGGADVLAEDGSRVRADWTGLMTRFGFSIPFDPGPYPSSGQ
jgi:hypothetical protein